MKRYFEEIEPKLVEFKDHNITIVCEKHVEALGLRYFDKEGAINNIYTVNELLEGKLDAMQFDYIVGNPPYQDGKKAGGQNKIYNLICKKVLTLLSNDGIISFITPVSVTTKNKRFSLTNEIGLKEVNFSIDKDFKEGITVCSWLIDKKYIGDVNVIDYDGNISKSKQMTNVYDLANSNLEFIELMNDLKNVSVSQRMFIRNGMSNFKNTKSNECTSKFQYPLYKLENSVKKIVNYNSKEPYFYKENKVNVGFSKSLSEDAIYYGTEDFEVNYLFTKANEDEYKNIKSFLLSDHFINLCDEWSKYTTHGFNYGIYYLPKFDKTRPWTNEEVQSFFENREWLK